MIIVSIDGGLGNQMFQYAIARRLELKGNRVKLHYRNRSGTRNSLEIFDLPISTATARELKKYGIVKNRIITSLNKRLFRKFFHFYRERNCFVYDEGILKIHKGYIQGFWQTEKYFLPIRKELLKEFSFPESKNEKNIELLKLIESKECVSVHIRRGDYLQFSDIYGNICTDEYYRKAFKYFSGGKNVKFIFFSNDSKWVKEHFKKLDKVVVDWNMDESYMDMYLMSRCKNNIIANSSFSWMAAWLNQHENKIVIAPKKWVNNQDALDICPNNWIRI